MSNLLEKASILTTPTAYNNGKILSVKPSIVLGEELVTNGDFSNGSTGWTLGTGWSIGTNKASATDAAFGAQLVDDTTLVANKKYKVTFDISDYVKGNVRVGVGNVFSSEVSSNGSFTFIITSSNTNAFKAQTRAGGGGTTLSISNVSVKEVIDGDFDFTRGSSATRINAQGLVEDVQILSSNLVQNGDFSQEGAELVTNGDFATDSDWFKDANWTIANGKATSTGVGRMFQSIPFLETNIGTTVQVSFDIIDITAGGVVVNCYGGVSQLFTTVGTHTFTTTTINNTNLYFNNAGAGNLIGSIDNVSVKEVGQDWTLSSAWTIGNNKAIFSDTIGGDIRTSSNVFTANKKYQIKLTVADLTSGTAFFGVGDGAASNLANYANYANGEHTFNVTAPIGQELRIYSTTSSGSSYSITNISVIEITDDTNLPRIDYTDGVGSWLFEPQSTNLITQSENLSNMQIAFGGAITLDSNFINPSGQKGSYFIYDTDGGTQSRFRVSNSGFTLGDKLSYSVFLKSNSSSLITIGGNYGGENCTFNVGSKTLISQGAAVDSYEIINFTNGWTRYIVNTTFTNTVPGNAYPFFTTNATLSEKIYLWGHQLEVQSFATSYIPTNGSTVTRLQDSAFGAGSSDLINSTEGVLYAEIAALVDDNIKKGISLSDGTTSNRIILRYDNASNRIKYIVVSSGVIQANMNTAAYDILDNLKIAVKFKENDFALWVNGIEIATDTSGNTFPTDTLSELNLDSTTIEPFYGKVKCVAVFKEALTDAELTCLTTI